MNSRQLERIFILILLLLNVFLLSVVLSDLAETRRSDAETTEALTALLEENGIAVARGTKLLGEAPQRLVLTRDTQAEGQKLRRLLGTYRQEDLGGNILFYRSDRGQAVLRGSGDFDILFQGDAVRLRGGEEKTARRLLRRVGVETRTVYADAGTDEDTVLLACMRGVPVYNALLRFDFSGQRLNILSGTRLFDGVKEERGEVMDGASVLMRFMEIVKTEGYICSRLDGLEPGYLLSVTMSGEGVLTPVWRIQTDTGALLINAETGKTENWLS